MKTGWGGFTFKKKKSHEMNSEQHENFHLSFTIYRIILHRRFTYSAKRKKTRYL